MSKQNLFSGVLNPSAADLLADYVELLNQPELNEEEWESLDWLTINEQVESATPTNEISEEAVEEIALRTAAEAVGALITVDQKPFDFSQRQYLKGLYEVVRDYPIGSRNQIWMAGRQVEKSSTQSAKSIILGAETPAFKTLYVAPRFDQVRVFSQQRFRPMCEDSPGLASWIQPSRRLWQVASREFANGSFFNFRSCYLNADNSRGISCHHLLIDEIQDIVSDAVPVLEECQSHALPLERFRSYAGTPKTTSNVITRRWNNSCQFEWLIKCNACNHWNYPDDEIVADDAFRCTKCKKVIVVANGRWVPARPELLNKTWGFRISQLIVPFKTHAEIKAKRDDPNVTRQKYYNECLGLPYDDGQLVLTEGKIRKACNERPMWTLKEIGEMANRGVPIFAGVDYGTGEGDNPSFTVLTIGFFNVSGKFQVLHMKKFKGKDADLAGQPGLINKLCAEAGVRVLGADWGFGADKNARLVREYLWQRYRVPKALLEFVYVTQGLLAKWEPNAERFHIDRNKSMALVIDQIGQNQIEFFRYEDFKEFSEDLTTIFIEYNDVTNTYKYDHSLPDDGFHSILYAYFAGRQFNNKLVPTIVPDTKNL